jgi:cell wall-associated NlpC family hydrolase
MLRAGGILPSVPARTVFTAGLVGVICAGCAAQQSSSTTRTDPTPPPVSTTTQHSPSPTHRAHPQAVEPVAGTAAPSSQPAPKQAGVSVGPPSHSLAQPITEAAIRRQLVQSGMSASTNEATLTPGGLAVSPVDAPAAVAAVVAAGNQIARLPYRYGGGHMTYEDTAYDCSGSISYVFAAAHLLDHTVASGELEHWGAAGPGKWITVFANAGHTFMYVAGLRFDTVALAETGSRWSNRPASDVSTFAVRHPPGL